MIKSKFKNLTQLIKKIIRIENYKALTFLFLSLNKKEKVNFIKELIKSCVRIKYPPFKILNFKKGYYNADININVEYIILVNDVSVGDIVVKLRKGTSDASVFTQVFGDAREYSGIVNLIKTHNQTNNIKVIIDAGSNVGFASIFFSKIFSEAKIIAIEPDDANIDSAKLNFRLNNLRNLTLLECGLWFKKCKLKIQNNFRDGQAWSLTVIEDKNGNIRALSLEDLLRDYNIEYIDVLKIDIEGSEKIIFENLGNENFLQKTKFLSMEIHDEFECRELIYNILEKYSFSYFESGEGIIAYNKSLLIEQNLNRL